MPTRRKPLTEKQRRAVTSALLRWSRLLALRDRFVEFGAAKPELRDELVELERAVHEHLGDGVVAGIDAFVERHFAIHEAHFRNVSARDVLGAWLANDCDARRLLVDQPPDLKQFAFENGVSIMAIVEALSSETVLEAATPTERADHHARQPLVDALLSSLGLVGRRQRARNRGALADRSRRHVK